MRNTADVTGGKPIAVLLQSISGVGAIIPLVRLLRHPWRKERVAILLFDLISYIFYLTLLFYLGEYYKRQLIIVSLCIIKDYILAVLSLLLSAISTVFLFNFVSWHHRNITSYFGCFPFELCNI
jgi:hypothetical protein